MKPDLCDPCADGVHVCLRRDWTFDVTISDGLQEIPGLECQCPQYNKEN